MRFKELGSSDVERAAEILAERGARQRRAVPLLPSYISDPVECGSAIADALRDGALGVAAFDGDEMQGYLLARLGEGVRGFHTWSTPECNAVRGDFEIIRRLYAEISGGWVEEGRGHHYAEVPSDNPAELDAWLRLAFGHEQAQGVRAVVDPPGWRSDLVRRAGPEDIDAAAETFGLIADAHQGSPTFTFIETDFRDELRAGHLELLEDASVGYFVVESEGGILGFAAFRGVPAEESTWYMPERSVYLIVAAMRPEARGRGLMKALVGEGLRWAADEGYELSVTDWRVTNLDSSRAWPALGYVPVSYRLHRILDPRVVPMQERWG